MARYLMEQKGQAAKQRADNQVQTKNETNSKQKGKLKKITIATRSTKPDGHHGLSQQHHWHTTDGQNNDNGMTTRNNGRKGEGGTANEILHTPGLGWPLAGRYEN